MQQILVGLFANTSQVLLYILLNHIAVGFVNGDKIHFCFSSSYIWDCLCQRLYGYFSHHQYFSIPFMFFIIFSFILTRRKMLGYRTRGIYKDKRYP